MPIWTSDVQMGLPPRSEKSYRALHKKLISVCHTILTKYAMAELLSIGPSTKNSATLLREVDTA